MTGRRKERVCNEFLGPLDQGTQEVQNGVESESNSTFFNYSGVAFDSGVAPANQTEERAKTKSS